MSILDKLKQTKISEIQTETLSPLNLEEIYNASKRDPSKSPFPLVYLVKVSPYKYVTKKYTLLPGITLEKNEKPEIDQVTPDSVIVRLKLDFEDIHRKHGGSVMLFMSDQDFTIRASQRQLATLYKLLGGDVKDLEIENLGLKEDATLEDCFEAYSQKFQTGRKGKSLLVDENGKQILLKVKFSWSKVGLLEFGRGNFAELPSEKVSGLSLLASDELVAPRRQEVKSTALPGTLAMQDDTDIFP